MNKFVTAVALALFALSGTAVHAADAAKKDAPAAAKTAEKAASGAMDKKDEAAKKSETPKRVKKGGC